MLLFAPKPLVVRDETGKVCLLDRRWETLFVAGSTTHPDRSWIAHSSEVELVLCCTRNRRVRLEVLPWPLRFG